MLEIIADMDGDDSKIEEQLEKLPGDVEPIYEKKLLQIQGSSDITLAKEVFQWLIISRRPLKIEGLARAYTVSEALKKKKRLVHDCAEKRDPGPRQYLYFFNPPQKYERHRVAAFKRVVEYLLAIVPGVAFENPDYDGFNPLQQVARHGYEGTVDILIGAGTGVNSTSDHQEICLHLAAENGKVDVVDLLLRRGASVDFSRYWDGRTTVYLAADKGSSNHWCDQRT